MRIAVATLGCKVNQYEGGAIAEMLAAHADIVPFKDSADAYIVNTCGVTAEAAHKSRKLLYRGRRANPAATIIAIGCYAALDAGAARQTGADLVLPKASDADTARAIAEHLGLGSSSGSTSSRPVSRHRRARRHLKVQDGCDQYCSYCVIPYARNTLISRAPEEAVAEASSMETDGAAEIVVTGIHVGKYGTGRPELPDLTGLLKRLLEATDSCRFRLSSIEATEVSAGLLELLANEPRVAPHLHVPLQCGSDTLLTAMNRPYDTVLYRDVVGRARAARDNLALTTDLIVGFPGETDDDLERSLAFAAEMAFSKIHVFSYSDRPPARAALMEPKVPESTKAERSAKARRAAAELRRRYARSRVDGVEIVAVERVSDGMASGTTGSYLQAHFPAAGCRPGDLVSVRVQGVQDDGCLLGVRSTRFPRSPLPVTRSPALLIEWPHE